jgi:hypothetical protein
MGSSIHPLKKEQFSMRNQSLKLAASLSIVISAALAGCGALDELDRMEVEGFKKTCTNLGIPPGSPDYDRCMLQQQAISENASQHSMDRIEMEELAKKRK